MRFVASVGPLRDKLALALSAANGRVRPILGSVRCVADGTSLTLTGTDCETAVSVTVEAEVETEGECLLPPTLAEALKLADGDTISLMAGKTLVVNVGGDLFELPNEDVADFPAPPDVPDPTFTVGCSVLATAIGKVIYAASPDEGKYAMRCVAWDLAKDGVRLVATDGKCLAVSELGVKFDHKESERLMPTKATAMVQKLCDVEGLASVVLRANDAFVTTPAGTMWTRLAEGRFPPWRDVIPKSGATTVNLDARAFCHAVKRAALTSDKEAKRVTCEFKASGLLMTAEAATRGRSAVAHAPTSHDGPDVTIHFAPEYLANVCKVGDAVTLSLIDGSKSAVFRADGTLCLVVPLV